MEDFDIKQYEQACNNIFPGLQMFVRDTILDNEVEKMYIIGKIIKDTTFCDASCRIGGLITSHRFAILSNRYVDFGPTEHGTNWGLYVCKRNSYFKILDVFKINDKTQISLLHLNEKFKLFENNTSNVEEDIIKMSRERFQNKYNMSPIPELATKEWLQRLLLPVGINQQNKYFPLDGEPLKKDDPKILESIKSMDSIIEKLVKVKEEWNSATPTALNRIANNISPILFKF